MRFGKSLKKLAKNVVPAAAGAGAGFLLGGPAGAAIGAGAGFGLGYLQDQQIRAQNKANQQAIDRANAYDMYTWDLANAYNSPKAQVQRLIDAGFNPYTQGAVDAGNASGTASSNGVAQQSVANKQALGLQLAQAGANLKQTLAQTELAQTQADIGAINAEVAGYHRDYESKQYDKFIETGVIPEDYHTGMRLYDALTGRSSVNDARSFISWLQERFK